MTVVQDVEPISFDLLDYRESIVEEKKNIHNEDPHSIFVIKRHLGVAAGYDNTVVHGSVGLYLTVAEWGRWNFGVPSVGFGWGRYPIYDRTQRQSMMKAEPTVFVSIASVHYRVSYLQSLGVNWYINLEQVYDLRYNMLLILHFPGLKPLSLVVTLQRAEKFQPFRTEPRDVVAHRCPTSPE